MSNSNKLILGSRSSKLALAQTELIINRLKELFPQYEYEIKAYKTQGDLNLSAKLNEFGGKGAFVQELEQDLKEKRIDFAIHSAKDLPYELAPNTSILCLLPREDPHDVLVTNNSSDDPYRIIGTSSARREMFIKKYYQEANIKLLRGNVQTRLNKLLAHEYDSIILAKAGLKRLNLFNNVEGLSFQDLPLDQFIPAAGQGIIALQLSNSHPLYNQLKSNIHNSTQIELTVERLILEKIKASCHDPVALFSKIYDNIIEINFIIKENNFDSLAKTRYILSINNNLELVAENFIKELRHE